MPRQQRRFRVEVNGWTGYTTDVSLGGFGAELSRLPRCGSEVRGEIQIGQASYSFSGTVVWVCGGEPAEGRRGRVGVRLSGVENAYLQSLTTGASNPL